jgi:hypothetical protein
MVIAILFSVTPQVCFLVATFSYLTLNILVRTFTLSENTIQTILSYGPPVSNYSSLGWSICTSDSIPAPVPFPYAYSLQLSPSTLHTMDARVISTLVQLSVECPHQHSQAVAMHRVTATWGVGRMPPCLIHIQRSQQLGSPGISDKGDPLRHTTTFPVSIRRCSTHLVAGNQ